MDNAITWAECYYERISHTHTRGQHSSYFKLFDGISFISQFLYVFIVFPWGKILSGESLLHSKNKAMIFLVNFTSGHWPTDNILFIHWNKLSVNFNCFFSIIAKRKFPNLYRFRRNLFHCTLRIKLIVSYLA